MASVPITSWQVDRETMETVTDFILGGSKITADGSCSHEIKRHLLLERKAMTNLHSLFKSRDITLPTKVHLMKPMVFSVVLEKTLESPLDCKEVQPVNPKENQSWIFTGRTDTEAEVPILWPPDAQSWLFGKDSEAGKDWGQEGNRGWDGGWHHWLNGHESANSRR